MILDNFIVTGVATQTKKKKKRNVVMAMENCKYIPI